MRFSEPRIAFSSRNNYKLLAAFFLSLSLMVARSTLAGADSASSTKGNSVPVLPTDNQTIADNQIEMPKQFPVSQDQKLILSNEIKDLSGQIKPDPTNNKARLQRSLDCLWLGRYSQARRDCDAVLKTDPSNIDALCEHACANFYLKNFSSTIYDCTL